MQSHSTKEDQELEEVELQTTFGKPKEKKKPNKGMFKKGKSGNPNGRPKGALGKATLVKQAVLAEAEGLILDNAAKVIKVVIEQAIAGCRQSQKLVLERLVAPKRGDEGDRKDKAPVIKIVVESMDTPKVEPLDIVDADFSEVGINEEEV